MIHKYFCIWNFLTTYSMTHLEPVGGDPAVEKHCINPSSDWFANRPDPPTLSQTTPTVSEEDEHGSEKHYRTLISSVQCVSKILKHTCQHKSPLFLSFFYANLKLVHLMTFTFTFRALAATFIQSDVQQQHSYTHSQTAASTTKGRQPARQEQLGWAVMLRDTSTLS